jgi:purine-binding chemotaxis protein CheW
VGYVVRSVDYTPIPRVPGGVLGVIDVGGTILPLLSPRQRFALADRAIDVDDQIIIAHTGRRDVALLVDRVDGVATRPVDDLISAQKIEAALGSHMLGVMSLEDGLILIHDLDRFLSPDQERTLDEAMSGGGEYGA